MKHESLWLLIPLFLLGAPFAVAFSPYVIEYVQRWRRRRVEPVDEWIVSLDGADVAILKDPVFVEMFWTGFTVVPIDESKLPLIYNARLWHNCRFEFRHRISGRIARAFSSASDAGVPTPASMQVVMRCLY